MEGQSLADYLNVTARAGNIPAPAEIVHLLMPIATTLDRAHQGGMLHGTLNPTVILFDRHDASSSLGEPTLVNFGMYRGRDPRMLSLNEVSYLAPEVAQGNAVTSRSDLYSLGVILYELCTGALPFQGETTSDILMQHIHGTPISPVLINPHIRPALTAVIIRSLARDPAERFSSATALVTAAARAMNVSVPESTSPSSQGLGVANPSSFSGINDPNTPTFLTPSISPPPVAQSTPVPPTVASGNTPTSRPSSAMPAITPVLPASSTGPVSQIPPTVHAMPQPSQASGPQPIIETRRPAPATPFLGLTGPVPQVPPTVHAMPSPSQVSGPHPVIANSGPVSVAPPVTPQAQPARRYPIPTLSMRNRRIAALALLLLAVLLLGLGAFYLISSRSSPTTQIVGNAFFTSSGLISTESNQGTTDGLNISLKGISDPQPGKSYYGWLVNTYGLNVSPLLIGALPVKHNQITMAYQDPNHDNLLANYSQFLITEEDAKQAPTSPSLDKNVWRYYSAFSTVPNRADPKQFSLVDHLRHLLSQDPKLKKAGLSGGLSEWLFRNVTKVLEAAGSARDTQKGCVGGPASACDTGLILRQVARILDYLDGAAYVGRDNIPTNIQGDTLLIDPNVAKVALLEIDTGNQDPPGYLKHIEDHLQLLDQVAGTTANQRTLANSIYQDISNVQGWLDLVHADALKVIDMSPSDLVQPDTLTVLNDLFLQANTAFVGQVDPHTDNVKDGVVQIYYHIQALATFDVAPCTMNNGQSSCTESGS